MSKSSLDLARTGEENIAGEAGESLYVPGVSDDAAGEDNLDTPRGASATPRQHGEEAGDGNDTDHRPDQASPTHR